MDRSYRPVVLVAVLILLAGSASAQAPAGRSATLAGWHDVVRTALRDRVHAYGGLFFDRGLFRRLTPAMDHEYDLDLLTYGFTPAEDVAWYASPHAVRTYMGSIHRSRFATQTRFRHRVALGARQELLLSGVQQEDLAAQRFFVEAGYARRAGSRHRFGLTQTVAAYKPDLDLTLFYEHAAPAAGTIRLELGLLDVANDLIFDVLGADPALEDTVRSYDRAPRLFAVAWESPVVRGFRGEVFAGVQPRARARIHSQRDPGLRFTWDDEAAYAGALVEYRHPWLTAGLSYRHTSSRVARRAPEGARHATDYTSAQASHAATLHLLAGRGRLHGGAWLTAERYRDVQRGTAFDQASIAGPFAYRERRLTLHARLHYVPPRRGFRTGLDYLVDGRTFRGDVDRLYEYLRFAPWSPNGRVALHVGYQFSPAASVAVGASYDLGGDPFYRDGRGPVRYDGGFGRVTVAW